MAAEPALSWDSAPLEPAPAPASDSPPSSPLVTKRRIKPATARKHLKPSAAVPITPLVSPPAAPTVPIAPLVKPPAAPTVPIVPFVKPPTPSAAEKPGPRPRSRHHQAAINYYAKKDYASSFKSIELAFDQNRYGQGQRTNQWIVRREQLRCLLQRAVCYLEIEDYARFHADFEACRDLAPSAAAPYKC